MTDAEWEAYLLDYRRKMRRIDFGIALSLLGIALSLVALFV
jgi:hypothetical protein